MSIKSLILLVTSIFFQSDSACTNQLEDHLAKKGVSFVRDFLPSGFVQCGFGLYLALLC